MKPQQILKFWFKDVNRKQAPTKELSMFWYGSNIETDQYIKKEFSTVLEDVKKAAESNPKSLMVNSESALASIIVLDQFPRNIYRKDPKAFSFDKLSQQLVQEGLAMGYDKEYLPLELQFFLMPLMHSEDIDLHKIILEKSIQLAKDYPFMEPFKSFEQSHYDTIAKFKRYPHRNEVLGRESNPEELEYLKTAERYGQ